MVAAFLSGCSTTPDENKGPSGTIAYLVRVDSSVPGVAIETNNVAAGTTPLQIKILGHKDGTFHNFGDPQFSVRALPLHTNQLQQVQSFSTGTKSVPADRIPGLIFFDMDNKSGSFSLDSFPEN